MSVEAITWALKQRVEKSSTKFVLVVLANCAGGAGFLAFPSVQYLVDSTGQDRKTVLENLKRLVDAGLIEDAGQRVGATKQVVVYRVLVDHESAAINYWHYVYRSENPGTGEFYIGVRSCYGEPANDTGYVGSGRWVRYGDNARKLRKTILATFTTREEAEEAERETIAVVIHDPLNRNIVIPPAKKSPKKGTVQIPRPKSPVFPSKSPKNATKQTQKRDTEPSEAFSKQSRDEKSAERKARCRSAEVRGLTEVQKLLEGITS